jgi:thiamine biosynthesis lipoprotein
MPTAAEVAEAHALVGSDKLVLDSAHRTIRFQQPGMELNLGAIGKGHALDRAAEVLENAGVQDYCIHGGNSSVGQGQPSQRIPPGWSIALHPLKPEVRWRIWLVDRAWGPARDQFLHHQGAATTSSIRAPATADRCCR